MPGYYSRPPKPNSRSLVDIPFHNSVVEGIPQPDLICRVGEGRNYPQGTLYRVMNIKINNAEGDPVGLMYQAICSTCEASFFLLYEYASGKLYFTSYGVEGGP